jgi:hypothetical protein
MTPGQQQRKDAQDAARREQQADERIRELEGLIRHFMSLTHPELGRAHDHPEFALHAIHARCAIEIGEYEDEVEAYAEMDVSDRSKPTRHDLEGEVKRLREVMADAIFQFDHGHTQDAIDTLRDALDGGGDNHATG